MLLPISLQAHSGIACFARSELNSDLVCRSVMRTFSARLRTLLTRESVESTNYKGSDNAQWPCAPSLENFLPSPAGARCVSSR
jgi:hypothetical protein